MERGSHYFPKENSILFLEGYEQLLTGKNNTETQQISTAEEDKKNILCKEISP